MVKRVAITRQRGTHVSQVFDKRLNAISAAGKDLLSGGLKGVEKESLRIDAAAALAQTPHPKALGSALTNRFITTDFSEALLEFVTPAYATTWEALQCICNIHQFTYANLQDEMLWPSSMPCAIPENDKIPLARYGTSNVGRMKTIYRRGLGFRYGRQMQTIAGVHFNYSLPETFWPAYQRILQDEQSIDDFRSQHYLGLIRNFRRMGWLVLYLFGASPALCKSFISGNTNKLASLNDETWYEPYGTSLRMSDIGYSNQHQSRINISLNSIDEYVHDLCHAICVPEPDYEKIGVKVDGEYRQLNANLLQLENEYYSSVRPKRVARSGERPTAALRRGGIEYVEVRSLDINLFDPCGINQNTMRFMEAFLIYCLLLESPPLDVAGLQEANANQMATAKQGRDPEFRLLRDGKATTVTNWAQEILAGVAAIAEQIDAHDNDDSYAEAVAAAAALVEHVDRTPSARIVEELQTSGKGFSRLGLEMAERHQDYFASLPPCCESALSEFETEARASLQRQAEIEMSDAIDLDEYLLRYFEVEC